MKLNDTKVRNLKPKDKTYRLSDGGGMYIEVMPNGSMYWRMNYRFLGKQKRLALGVYPRVSLKEARDKREDARKLLDNGKDPSEIKKLQKIELRTNYENSFENVAKDWHESRKHAWQPKHAETILSRLNANIFPVIGSRPIKAVTPQEVLAAIRPIEEQGKHEMAHRMLQTCSQVMRFAVASGLAERDITADLKGALKPVKSKNYAHLKEEELPEFLEKLERYEEDYNGSKLVKLAFKLLILTFVRSGEIRGAEWDEIYWDKKLWKIPAERMKMKDPHIVPLSDQSIAILKEVKQITGSNPVGLIFPSLKNPRNIISENTFLRAIELMGYKGRTTAHGFRSTASTILNENGFNRDHIERQLAHAERDQVRSAYNHAEYLTERTQMMQWWADYIENS